MKVKSKTKAGMVAGIVTSGPVTAKLLGKIGNGSPLGVVPYDPL